jgi:hypothetical protein
MNADYNSIIIELRFITLMNAIYKTASEYDQVSTKISVIYVGFYCVNIIFVYEIAVRGGSKCSLLCHFKYFRDEFFICLSDSQKYVVEWLVPFSIYGRGVSDWNFGPEAEVFVHNISWSFLMKADTVS